MTNHEDRLSKRVIDELRELYKGNIKHSNYQPLPDYLQEYFPDLSLNTKWRDPNARIALLKSEINTANKSSITEIGANTGFQSLLLAKSFPDIPYRAYEGSIEHSRFIRLCNEIEKLDNLEVLNEYYSPENLEPINNGIILDFNVAHHIGSDFRSLEIHNENEWWEVGLPSWIKPASNRSNEYWFSVGYRMGGIKGRELHDPSDPEGMLEKLIDTFSNVGCKKISTFCITSDDLGNLAYINTNLISKSLNSHLQEMHNRELIVGEYFNRLILRVN